MAKKEMTYAESMAQIEKILARFRNEEMDVDSLAAEVKRATELIAAANRGCARPKRRFPKYWNRDVRGNRHP